MNGFHFTPELLRQIEATSTAMESIRRAQKALDHAPVLEGIRRAQEDARRTQQALRPFSAAGRESEERRRTFAGCSRHSLVLPS